MAKRKPVRYSSVDIGVFCISIIVSMEKVSIVSMEEDWKVTASKKELGNEKTGVSCFKKK